MKKIVRTKKVIKGVINLPADKSISHRALILGAIANGQTQIKNFSFNNSCRATLNCLKDLGADIKILSNKVVINGQDFLQPKKILNAQTSGTTLRLMLGLLATQKFPSQIKCIGSLKKRPMNKLLEALRKMGAKITLCDGTFFIEPSQLSPIEYKMPVPSAQIKSAVILSSLFCNGTTKIIEPIKSRNHTETMINYFDGKIFCHDNKILCVGRQSLTGKQINLPADTSSAAFFIVLASIFPKAHIILRNVLVNPRRTGLIRVLQKMGAKIFINNQHEIYPGEDVADIEVCSSQLKSIQICGDIVVDMIDEFPAFIVAALFSKGTSIVKNVRQLKFKESDRIMTVAEEFNRLGAKIKPTSDGMIIEGGFDLNKNCEVFSHGDHRIAMSLAIFAIAANKELVINDAQCVDDSFPDFFDYLDIFF